MLWLCTPLEPRMRHTQFPLSRFLRRVGLLGLPLLGGLAAAGTAQAQPYGGHDRGHQQGQGIVRCESVRNRSRECPLNGQPQLIRQLSGSPCVRGESWGPTRNGVWVSRGCRAEFVAQGRGRPGGGWGHGGWGHGNGNGPGDHRGQLITCNSDKHRQRRCDADVRRSVRLVRQLSSSACVQGRSWGWDRRGVWVSNGCRAQFQIN